MVGRNLAEDSLGPAAVLEEPNCQPDEKVCKQPQGSGLCWPKNKRCPIYAAPDQDNTVVDVPMNNRQLLTDDKPVEEGMRREDALRAIELEIAALEQELSKVWARGALAGDQRL